MYQGGGTPVLDEEGFGGQFTPVVDMTPNPYYPGSEYSQGFNTPNMQGGFSPGPNTMTSPGYMTPGGYQTPAYTSPGYRAY
jgi:hypothetical protein